MFLNNICSTMLPRVLDIYHMNFLKIYFKIVFKSYNYFFLFFFGNLKFKRKSFLAQSDRLTELACVVGYRLSPCSV